MIAWLTIKIFFVIDPKVVESVFIGIFIISISFYTVRVYAYNTWEGDVVSDRNNIKGTIKGWTEEIDEDTLEFCKKFINYSGEECGSEFIWTFIKTAFACVGDTLIIQMQDYLELGADARMNTPSTSSGNWKWRMKSDSCTEELAEKIADITRTYGRCMR